MALSFSKVYKYIDNLAEMYKKKSEHQYLNALVEFYETALQETRLTPHKKHCVRTIYELNPAFFKGYFNKEHP